MASVISSRPLTPVTQVWAQVTPHGICRWQSGTVTGFSSSTSVSPSESTNQCSVLFFAFKATLHSRTNTQGLQTLSGESNTLWKLRNIKNEKYSHCFIFFRLQRKQRERNDLRVGFWIVRPAFCQICVHNSQFRDLNLHLYRNQRGQKKNYEEEEEEKETRKVKKERKKKEEEGEEEKGEREEDGGEERGVGGEEKGGGGEGGGGWGGGWGVGGETK